MKSLSSFAFGMALVVGSTAFAPSAQAKNEPPAQAQPGQRTFKFSKEERAALLPVQTAVAAKDWAAAAAALPAAQAAAQGTDAKYAAARYMLEIGLGTSNSQMQAQAIDALLASGGVAAADLPVMYRNQGALALQLKDMRKAEAAFTRVVELTPNDPDALVNLAKVKSDTRKPQEAASLLQRAIAAKLAAGQKADESWYKYALKLAYESKMRPESLKLSRDLIAAYPTKENWRDALLIYRELADVDKVTNLDLLRLMRATKSLAGERDWYELADALNMGGLPGEAKAVLEEGSSAHMVDLNKAGFRDLLRAANLKVAGDKASLAGSEAKALAAATGTLAMNTADAYFGYGDYAKAATLYRAAAGKSGVDANIANLRLGMALAMTGNRAEAETAFRAVTGPRADLAGFWLAWLAQRG